MSRVRRPSSAAAVPAPAPACWRRLAVTVLGVGGLIGLLGLALLVVVYFLPAPLLVVPAAAALGAVAYVTRRGRAAEAAGAATSRVSLPAYRPAPRVVEAPAPRRSSPAWPTGRHRGAVARRGRHRQVPFTPTWAN